jgi:hypothetical protein
MKPNCIPLAAACFLLLLTTACQKERLQGEPMAAQKAALQVSGNKNTARNLQLKEMTFGDRHYLFVYNRRGDVDSVIVSGDIEYVYKVYYKGSHIDSVNLLTNGQITSTNTNFQYQGNLITSFDYFYRAGYYPFPHSFYFTYDNQKRIQTISDNSPAAPEELTYDSGNNVIGWSRPAGSYTATYTYSDKLNPLYYVDNLFAIFVEEHFIYEYAFSQHVSITKTYSDISQTNVLVSYNNQYNSLGQLISKTFFENNGTGKNVYTFTYY